MPPASGAASSRVVHEPAAGPSGCSRAWTRPITPPRRMIARERAALGPQVAGERDVDRRRAHRDSGAGEIGDVEPRLGAREAAVRRLGEIEAAGRLAAEAEAGREGVEHREVEAVEPRLDDQPVAPAPGEPDPAPLQRHRRRRKPPDAAGAGDLGRLGEAEIDIVDMALHRRADAVRRDRGIGGDAERHAAPPFGEQLRRAVAAPRVDAEPGPLDEEVAAGEAGELGVADDRRLGRQDRPSPGRGRAG